MTVDRLSQGEELPEELPKGNPDLQLILHQLIEGSAEDVGG